MALPIIDWGPVRRPLEENRSFLVTSHVNPEADAIGSEMALARFLRERGAAVRIVNPTPTPVNCRFLDPEGEIIIFDKGRANAVLDDVCAVVILDLSSWVQLGAFGDAIRERDPFRICIDHHLEPDPGIAPVSVIDPTAAATGILIHELIGEMGGTSTPAIAEALYAALIVDTGCFRFSNTDERALRTAAELVRAGVRPERAYREAFENRRLASVKLLPLVFAALERGSGGKVLAVRVTKEMLSEAGARHEDTEGFIELLRAVKGVEVCAVFKEQKPERIRVSLRSTGDVDVSRFARSFGGGGHAKAAGLTVEKSMEEAVGLVLSGLDALLAG
ncbi:MAG: bifunctional oligoribonuclease/PAP phosphatase NrnA [Candidatus Eisenbacteria bacterium]